MPTSKTSKNSKNSRKSGARKTVSSAKKYLPVAQKRTTTVAKRKHKRKSLALRRFEKIIAKPATKVAIATTTMTLGIFLLAAGIYGGDQSLEDVQNSVVYIKACNDYSYDCGSGSGFAVFASDLIVTNYHVIKGHDDITIRTTKDVEGSPSEVVAFDVEKDIAILKWDNKLTPIRTSSVSKTKVGDKVYAIGNPLGETNVTSEGIISKKDTENGIMTTAAISAGSSGGVLILDSNHRAVGITYLKKTEGESMNYAIAIDDAKELYDAYKSKTAKTISSNNSECYPVLSNLDSDHSKLTFTRCEGDNEDTIYSVNTLSDFGNITNQISRFEYALSGNTSWKPYFTRLNNTAKGKIVDTYLNTITVTWKQILWLGNEIYYYSCQTSACIDYRFKNGFYPLKYDEDSEGELDETQLLNFMTDLEAGL